MNNILTKKMLKLCLSTIIIFTKNCFAFSTQWLKEALQKYKQKIMHQKQLNQMYIGNRLDQLKLYFFKN